MKGILLFAFNNAVTDYYQMACYTAARARRFLNLPCTVVTNKSSITCDYNFDNIIVVDNDSSNYRKKDVWNNKGRYRAYELTPYDETLVIDTDYMINSSMLLKLFESNVDFLCYKNTHFFFEPDVVEKVGKAGPPTLWATVMRFSKTNRVQQIFSMIETVEKKYDHYSSIYSFIPQTFRNDYALTIALKTINGHIENNYDYIRGKLNHVSLLTWVERIDDTTYKIFNKPRGNLQEYIIVHDHDFHMLSKKNFIELMK